MPRQFRHFMHTVRNLDFDETPDYKSYIKSFRKLYNSENYDSETFDWE